MLCVLFAEAGGSCTGSTNRCVSGAACTADNNSKCACVAGYTEDATTKLCSKISLENMRFRYSVIRQRFITYQTLQLDIHWKHAFTSCRHQAKVYHIPNFAVRYPLKTCVYFMQSSVNCLSHTKLCSKISIKTCVYYM